jgi:preprotein translocase subunit Sec63
VFHVSNEPSSISRNNTVVHPIAFSTLVRNVHLQHPDHFKYRNFYSRLGLPRHANESLVKSQYRRLARVYHPDRNIGKPDTRHKFQAVTEAYNSIMNE